ncbi:MAG TPA: DUF2254 domain-containing protein, partial [Candidatus Limnocylindria bacterium]|nr:DUF2254 domain-containing protein [Candidatus Limnocylindria bacterium]
MTVLALCLALLSIALDSVLESKMRWAYGGGPEGARAVLAAIAGSMITVAGVAFSIMIVALTLASQQFGPRLLRNFMRDTGNQVVLGTFIATFTYCLIVLRTIRGGESEFVPHVSVTLAIVFALVGLGVLIYFIHHAAVSIQAPEVIALVANDLEQGIERLFPERLGHPPQEDQKILSQEIVNDFETRGDTIEATESGYLQSIDNAKLMAVAQEKALVLLVKCRPGDFVVSGGELARCQPRGVDDDTAKAIQQAFIFGTQRTHLQDVEFSIDQLVEVAVRALSPGVNDPFTAINCIDRMAAALCLLAQRSFPSPFRHDDRGKLRVIARPVTFAGMVNAAFDSTRQYGRSSVAVTIRLLEAIATVARCVKWQAGRDALLVQALMIERASREVSLVEKDRADVEERLRKALDALNAGPIPAAP